MKSITDIVREVRGQICWGVKWDNQLGLSMSFGEPRLAIIRQPYISKSTSKRIQESSAFRHVKVSGEWWLWIFCAYTKLSVSDSLTVTDSSSTRRKRMAMTRLEGQKFKGVRVDPLNGYTEFMFDLGAKIQARRYEDDDSDIWTLYKPNGYALGVRGDGKFTYSRGTTPGDEQKPIPIAAMDGVAKVHTPRNRQQRAQHS